MNSKTLHYDVREMVPLLEERFKEWRTIFDK